MGARTVALDTAMYLNEIWHWTVVRLAVDAEGRDVWISSW